MSITDGLCDRIAELEAQLAEAKAVCKGLLDYAPGEVCYQRYLDLHGGKCKCLNCTGNREAIETIRRAKAMVDGAGLNHREEVAGA